MRNPFLSQFLKFVMALEIKKTQTFQLLEDMVKVMVVRGNEIHLQ